MKRRAFYAVGLRPVLNESASKLLTNSDLGIEGVYIRESFTVAVFIDVDSTEEQLASQHDAIIESMESEGWTNVTLAEVPA